MRIAIRRAHLNDAPADLEDGHVEGPAPQIPHQDGLVGFFSSPYAREAAVGSLMMRSTSRPAI
jgi:hypothetical protein